MLAGARHESTATSERCFPGAPMREHLWNCLAAVAATGVTRSNAVAGGELVFLGGDHEGAGRFMAIDTTRKTAHTLWQLMIIRGGLASTPAFFGDVVYIGGGDGNVYAVAAASREAMWAL